MLNSDPNKLSFMGIDLLLRARRRWVVAATYFSYFVVMISLVMMTLLGGATAFVDIFQRYHLPPWFLGSVLMFTVSWIFSFFGVFREGGPVKISPGSGWRLSGFQGEWVLLRDLNDWAKYKFGDNFDTLSKERQDELHAYLQSWQLLLSIWPKHSPERTG